MERVKVEVIKRVRLLTEVELKKSMVAPEQGELNLVALTDYCPVSTAPPPCTGWWDFLTTRDAEPVRLWYDRGNLWFNACHLWPEVDDESQSAPGSMQCLGTIDLYSTTLSWRGLAQPWPEGYTLMRMSEQPKLSRVKLVA